MNVISFRLCETRPTAGIESTLNPISPPHPDMSSFSQRTPLCSLGKGAVPPHHHIIISKPAPEGMTHSSGTLWQHTALLLVRCPGTQRYRYKSQGDSSLTVLSGWTLLENVIKLLLTRWANASPGAPPKQCGRCYPVASLSS